MSPHFLSLHRIGPEIPIHYSFLFQLSGSPPTQTPYPLPCRLLAATGASPAKPKPPVVCGGTRLACAPAAAPGARCTHGGRRSRWGSWADLGQLGAHRQLHLPRLRRPGGPDEAGQRMVVAVAQAVRRTPLLLRRPRRRSLPEGPLHLDRVEKERSIRRSSRCQEFNRRAERSDIPSSMICGKLLVLHYLCDYLPGNSI
ncbi:hypothetical protein EJB05_50240, partial [Eragrostis curvula]